MSDGRDGVPAVGSRLSGEPTPAEPNWPLLYGIVLAELVILIAAFYAFTKAFA
jgi:hypothetical protein